MSNSMLFRQIFQVACVVCMLVVCTTQALAQQSQAPAIADSESSIDLEEYFRRNPGNLSETSAKVVGSANSVVVKGIRALTINGILRVDALLFNDRGRRDIVNYRLRWLDKKGMMFGQYGSWEVIALDGKQQCILSFRAPSDEVTDFRIELKLP